MVSVVFHLALFGFACGLLLSTCALGYIGYFFLHHVVTG
jgi:hypothetical protein